MKWAIVYATYLTCSPGMMTNCMPVEVQHRIAMPSQAVCEAMVAANPNQRLKCEQRAAE